MITDKEMTKMGETICRHSDNAMTCGVCRNERKPEMNQSNKELPIEKMSKKLCEEISEKLDHGILEEVISLFNSGVLKLFLQAPRHNIDHNNFKLTVSQCYRVLFTGKEKIKEQENEIEKLNEQVKLLEENLWRYRHMSCDIQKNDMAAKEALQKLQEMREKNE